MSLKVRSRVTQRYPRMVLYRNDRTSVFHRCAVGLVLVRGREVLCCTKVELYQEHTRDKVRSRFTLLVTARAWWDDRTGTTLLVVLTVVVVRDSFSKGQR